MKHNSHSTDGFVVRRRESVNPSLPRPTLDHAKNNFNSPVHTKPPGNHQLPLVVRRTASDLDQALPTPNSHKPHDKLKDINLGLDGDKKPPTGRRKRFFKGKWPAKRIIKWSAIGLGTLAVIIGGYFIYKLIITGGQVFKGNVVNAVFAPPKQLAMDQNGRSNAVLFGTSEDDPDHAGADLTDSIMVVSVDQSKKDAFLISIPRDLYVDYGRACPAGYQGRINALYSCVKEEAGEEAGQEALRKKIGAVVGLDIQYSAHVNYAALREAVDAVGGITVTIDSKDPRGILDRNFDWDCPRGLYSCYNVKYPNGPANLDGKHALYLARARGANGDTYGLPQANFDREKYQRAIIVALKDKAVSAGTLTNPGAVNNLLSILGKNVRTNFAAEEIKTLVKLAQDVKSESIASIPLNDPDAPLVTTGNINGQSVVRPVPGMYDYSELHAIVKIYSTGDKTALEKATVDVFNASGTPGLAQTKAVALEDEGLLIGTVDNASGSLNTAPVQIYDLSGKTKPATRQKLEQLLGVAVKDQPEGGLTGVSSSAHFVVIIGTPATQ